MNVLSVFQGYFPFPYNVKRHWNTIKCYPPLKYYFHSNMAAKDKAEVIQFYNEQVHSYDVFDFNKVLYDYCVNDTMLLRKVICQFLLSCFKFQLELYQRYSHHFEEDSKKPFIHPFSRHYCTISSYSFSICKYFSLSGAQSKFFTISDGSGINKLPASKSN